MVCLTRARLHTTREDWQRAVGQGGGVSAEQAPTGHFGTAMVGARPRLVTTASRTSSVSISIGSNRELGNIDFCDDAGGCNVSAIRRDNVSCLVETRYGRSRDSVWPSIRGRKSHHFASCIVPEDRFYPRWRLPRTACFERAAATRPA